MSGDMLQRTAPDSTKEWYTNPDSPKSVGLGVSALEAFARADSEGFTEVTIIQDFDHQRDEQSITVLILKRDHAISSGDVAEAERAQQAIDALAESK